MMHSPPCPGVIAGFAGGKHKGEPQDSSGFPDAARGAFAQVATDFVHVEAVSDHGHGLRAVCAC